MNFIEFCVAFCSAILTVAYPIIIEVISRLDDKYSSALLANAFYLEIEFVFFRLSLYSSLIFLFLYFIFFKTWSLFEPNPFMEAVNLIGCILSTACLIIGFLFLIKKIFIYYRPTFLIQYFKECDQKVLSKDCSDRKNIYFDSLVDMMKYSLRSKNIIVGKTLSSYFYDGFRKYRISGEGEIEYPSNYYQLVYDSVEELAVLNHDQFSFWANNTAGSNLLIGELAETKISKRTYSVMWHCQLKAIKLNRSDFIQMHWQNCHQFFNYQLNFITPQYSKSTGKVLNKEIVDQRDNERKEFFNFHIFLGAYTLFKKKYDLINFYFTYTQSIPEDYPLLPTRMEEIFNLFYKINDDFNDEFSWISSKFSFPEFSGMKADYEIKKQINQYLTILFLRQYSLKVHLVYQTPLVMPNFPVLQSEKRLHLGNIKLFRLHLKNILENKILLRELNLSFLKEEYFTSNKIIEPIKMIDEYLETLENSIEVGEVEQKISTAKRDLFYTSTKILLEEAFKLYDFFTTVPTQNKMSNNFINGTINVFDKKAFADNEGYEVHGLNTVFGNMAAERFQMGIIESFILKKTDTYTIDRDDTNQVLEILEIDKNNCVIIAFMNDELNLDSSFEFHQFPAKQSFGPLLFVLKKEDLPSVEFLDPRDNYHNHDLDELLPEYKTYASILDLHEKKHFMKK